MKNIMLSIMLVIAGIMVISCGNGVSKSKPEGWINEDTFRVMGMGVPSDDITEKFQREITAKQAAELDAKNKIVSKIVGSYVESLSASEKGMLNENVIQERVAGRIRGVSVIETKWDGKQNCTVVSEVYSKGLKKQMDELMKQYLKEVGLQSTAEDVVGRIPVGQ